MYHIKGKKNGHRSIINARKAAYEAVKANPKKGTVIVDSKGKEVGRVSCDYYPRSGKYVVYWMSEDGVWELQPSGNVRYRQ